MKTCNRRFIVRIESEGQVNFQIAHGPREAMQLATALANRASGQRVAVLDPSGREVWSSS